MSALGVRRDKAAFQSVGLAIGHRAIGRHDTRHGIDGDDDRPFKALGGVHRKERVGFFLRIGPAFDGARLVGPSGGHCLGEGTKAAHGVTGREAQIEIDISERAFGLTAMTLEKKGANRITSAACERSSCGVVLLPRR
jgi:hypothetical protein